MTQKHIINYLTSVKADYKKEGFIIEGLFGSYSRGEETNVSDVDILVDIQATFAEKYGFQSIKRIHEIELEMEASLGLRVDIADKSGMGKTATKFIIDRVIHV